MHKMAEAAWVCGDPGIQYDTTVNDWHPCINTARINASNPCSEYMFLDDSACNLASLNLRKFQDARGDFDVVSFRKACATTITAMEIIVDNSKYPTEKIAQNSWDYRPLGLGFANLGALLMSRGLPYDSAPGRAYAGAITAIMCGEAYRQSAQIAADATGPFVGYAKNEQPMMRVMRKHRQAVEKIDSAFVPYDLMSGARAAWDEAIQTGEKYGFRNGQVTVLAPTGTIAFLMDCDTTGVEPDIALVKYKRLVGGGLLKTTNQTVPEALAKLGYDQQEIEAIVAHIAAKDTIEGAPGLKDEHLPVFDCAFRSSNGTRSIHYMGHLRMMAAAQPFLSGAISKTVNLPNDCTIEDIEDAYIQAWKMGLKAIAVYRDGCKRTQPLSTNLKQATSTGRAEVEIAPTVDPLSVLADDERAMVLAMREKKLRPAGPPVARRHKLADERMSFTHKFSIGGHEGYITVGLYADGTPGRDLRAHGQGRQRHRGAHGQLRDGGEPGAAARRAAADPGRQVQGHAVRAERLHRQPGDPDRDVDHGLHLPVAVDPVPGRRESDRAAPGCARGAARPAARPADGEGRRGGCLGEGDGGGRGDRPGPGDELRDGRGWEGPGVGAGDGCPAVP
jgi:ribonucleoside-diphosphate reductase alpha chain